MPYYFFDITDDKITHDFKGKQSYRRLLVTVGVRRQRLELAI